MTLKNKLREFFKVAAGFTYDFHRYLRHSSTFSLSTDRRLDYRIAKVYHSLEKSLAFRVRRPGAGGGHAAELADLLSDTDFASEKVPFHRKVGIKVLRDWHELEADTAPKSATNLITTQHIPDPLPSGGAERVDAADLSLGKMDDPETFFFSRRSVRDYSSRPVDEKLIERAIHLAMASPSVCSRHAWYVYHTSDRSVIDQALTFQNGNRGFGHEVPVLFVVAIDLSAFHKGMERYQPWIDGGLFAMSLAWALHSLGVSGCFLNWDQGPRSDLAFRRAFDIDDAHTIITMLAAGYPKEEIKVCASPRRPLNEIHAPLRIVTDAVGPHKH